jgi:Ser/Thr protein kinase RdoA (MazF antagonist)
MSLATGRASTIVSEKYFDDQAKVNTFGSGAINTTYLVEVGDKKYILQLMNDMFLPAMMVDFEAVTDYLGSLGWEVPAVVRTKIGTSYVTDEAGWWRMMTFVASDSKRPESLVQSQYEQIGGLLARLHSDLARLDHQLIFTLPHYHDTDYYRQRLQAVLDHFDSTNLHNQATATLKALEDLPPLPSVTQLTHADTQTSNILFRDGRPFTFIDFDTLMVAGVWIDIGDMLRSLAEDALEQGRALPLDTMYAVIDGYYAVSQADQSHEEFVESCIVAAQLIALQLSMRFLTDVVEDSYFTHDPSKFSTRREYNEHRAKVQWELYIKMKELLHV